MEALDTLLLRLRRSRKANAFVRRLPGAVQRQFAATAEDAAMRRFYRSSLVPATALEAKYREALRLLREHVGDRPMGDYLEFGVCHGTSMLCMHDALEREGMRDVRLFGFDSFDGLPDSADFDDDGAWGAGWYKSSYDMTQRRLTRRGIDWQRTKLVKGWFSDTLTPHFLEQNAISRAAVIMIDCDMYLSAKEALTYCARLIGDGTIVFFDDWDSGGKRRLSDNHLGERRAFEEFLQEHRELVAVELPELRYRTTDPTSEAYSRCFLVMQRTAAHATSAHAAPSRLGKRLALTMAATKATVIPLLACVDGTSLDIVTLLAA